MNAMTDLPHDLPHDPSSPFHADELALQQRLGVRRQMEPVGRHNLRDHMPEQHRTFFGQLPFFFVGALDADGQPWATILAGAPGFLSTPDARTLRIAGGLLPGDPLRGHLHAGDYLAGLGLEPVTRRRNRVNGVIASVERQDDGDGAGQGAGDGADQDADSIIDMTVTQSFGNCPQYIQQRGHGVAGPRAPAPTVLRAATLSQRDRALIAGADTFFIASANVDASAGVARGVDMSHRGGRPGFVRVDADGTLTAPDFAGNFFFNTLGNLAGHPRAGLLFVDYASGDLLHLAVEAEIIWDGPELQAFAGAERLVRMRVREAVRNVAALPLRWSEPRPSPFVARTGTWLEAGASLAAAALPVGWRPFRVAASAPESAGVRSFYLEPADGMGLAPHVPGQYIPLRVNLGPKPDGETAIRHYTLSDAPDGRRYRISVKRDGRVSTWLHAKLAAGGNVEVMAPRGDFTFEEGTGRPAVLLSAGIGITPMIAMLNGLLVNGSRTRHHHAIHFIHGARSPGELAFSSHLRSLAAGHRNLGVHIRYSGAHQRTDLHSDIVNWQASAGRVDAELLRSILPFDDYDFYLCGPGAFMQQLYDDLRRLNIADSRIRFEAFGPASVRRDTVAVAATDAAATDKVAVRFTRSNVDAIWEPKAGTLLELAEAAGVAAQSGCRAGACGACAVTMNQGQGHDQGHGTVAGTVIYRHACSAPLEAGQVLLCSAVPAAGSGAIALDL